MRRHQTEQYRKVTQSQEIALLGLLIILMFWPDVTLAFGIWQGLPAVGFNPWCAVFAAKPAMKVRLNYVLHNAMTEGADLIKKLIAFLSSQPKMEGQQPPLLTMPLCWKLRKKIGWGT